MLFKPEIGEARGLLPCGKTWGEASGTSRCCYVCAHLFLKDITLRLLGIPWDPRGSWGDPQGSLELPSGGVASPLSHSCTSRLCRCSLTCAQVSTKPTDGLSTITPSQVGSSVVSNASGRLSIPAMRYSQITTVLARPHKQMAL